jgi:hypothetical protein
MLMGSLVVLGHSTLSSYIWDSLKIREKIRMQRINHKTLLPKSISTLRVPFVAPTGPSCG